MIKEDYSNVKSSEEVDVVVQEAKLPLGTFQPILECEFNSLLFTLSSFLSACTLGKQ